MSRKASASTDATPSLLGPPQSWPQNLKTSVRVVLTSNHPMLVWWGEQLINLYNDGYATFLYSRHPAALGQPASTVWPEIWHLVGPRAESAIQRDEAPMTRRCPSSCLGKATQRKPTLPSPTVPSRTMKAALAEYSVPSRRNPAHLIDKRKWQIYRVGLDGTRHRLTGPVARLYVRRSRGQFKQKT